MNTRKLTHHPLSILLIVCAVFPLLLSACQPVNVSTSHPPMQPTATILPAQPSTATQPPASASGDITLNLSGQAQNQTVETVAAVPARADEMWFAVAPQHHRVTLQGYSVTGRSTKPQIFIYPVADLAAFDEGAGRIATDLQAPLQARQPVDSTPFLPRFNAIQAMHAHVEYLDFKNGKGVCFLAQFNQGSVSINNLGLIYTFQGLTSDGKCYIAAVLPVTHPELPATEQVNAQLVESNEYPAYLTKTVTWLDQQPNGSFTPDLTKLDALIQSIEVK
jgi:hypothetical protein